jgi:hypothetical protein
MQRPELCIRLPVVVAGAGHTATDRRSGGLSRAGHLYESFEHRLTIPSGLPSAGLFALLTLLLFEVDLSRYAFVGIIMMIGNPQRVNRPSH